MSWVQVPKLPGFRCETLSVMSWIIGMAKKCLLMALIFAAAVPINAENVNQTVQGDYQTSAISIVWMA
jgi:hypothetical protein